MTLDNFEEISRLNCGEVILKALKGDLVIPDFAHFKETVEDIFDEVESCKGGEVAGYIPQLAEANPEQFGVSICTVDG